MAEIHGTEMSDEQFMLSMELGKILNDENYPLSDSEIDVSKVKSQRAKDIIARLEELSKETN